MFPEQEDELLDLDEGEEENEDKATEEEDDTPDFEVPDDESEEFVVPPKLTPRQQKRADRGRAGYKEQSEGRRAAEQERDDARAEIAELRRQRQVAPPTPAAPTADPYKEKLQGAHDRRQEIYQSYNDRVRAAGDAGIDAAEQKEWQRKSQKAEDDIAEVRLDRHSARRSAHDAGNEAKRMVRSRHADVATNTLAWNEANAAYQRAIGPRHEGGQGKPDNLETLDVVMDDIRERYQMGEHRHGGRNPTDRDRQRTTGVPRGGGKRPDKRKGFKMTALDREMADEAFGHIEDEKKRYSHYGSDDDT